MKKTLLLCSLIVPGAMAFGKTLTPAEALNRVSSNSSLRHVTSKTQVQDLPVLTVKCADGFTGAYVFANPDQGFMVVSADDCGFPLLGYSETGRFDVNNLPPQLKGWLDFYARQLEWASRHGARLTASSDSDANDYAPISPLVKSKWNQSAPYNDDCPLDNGERSVTGCVATAMAQAMYYHQWPATGTGSHSYTWNGTTLSVDFANTTYDWSSMTPTYDDSSSTAAKDAVAELMYSCGVSVDMNYSSDESGASSMTMVSALYKYFNYDRSMTFPQRSFYGQNEWEEMVYDQLCQGLPVLYCGQSGEGGHQFICDGYEGNHYFHFNWGWSGLSDGYYLLSALDPLEQGIGGSASDAGFNYDQGIVLNMKPAVSGSKTTPLVYCYSNFGTTSSGSVSLGERVTFNGDYFNFACSDLSAEPGIKLVDGSGTVTYIGHGSRYGFGAFSGYASYDVKLPESLAEGQYVVTPVMLPEGSSEWTPILCPLSGVQALSMTVADGVVSFADDISNAVEVSDFTLNSPIYLGKDFSASFTLTNSGTTEYFGEYVMALVDENGDRIVTSSDIDSIDLLPGQSQSISYIGNFAATVDTDSGEEEIPAGTYYLAIYTHFTDRQIYIDSTPVNVEDAPAQTSVQINSLVVDNGEGVYDKSDVTFSGTAECTEGYFTGRLKIAVFRSGTYETDLTGSTGYLFLNAGETGDFEAHVNISSAEGSDFYAVVFDGNTQISNSYSFKVEAMGVDGIESEKGIMILTDNTDIVVKSESGLDNVRVFAIDGRVVYEASAGGATEFRVPATQLTKGEYIVTAIATDAQRATSKIVR